MFCKLLSQQFQNECSQISKYGNRAIILGYNQVREYNNIKTRKHNAEMEIGLHLSENSNGPVERKPTLQFPNIADIRTCHNMKSAVKQPYRVINDVKQGLQFIRIDMQNPRLRSLMVGVKSQKRNEKNREVIVEGWRLIKDALKCGLHMHALFFSQSGYIYLLKDEVIKAQYTMKTQLYKVPQHDLKTWSCLTSPPGLLAIFKQPSPNHMKSIQKSALPITVVCDNIREPTNLGSVIRSCSAIPCSKVIVTRGCCDPWESKALRGGSGGQFRIPIIDNVKWEDLHLSLPSEVISNCRIFIAENNIAKIDSSNIQSINYTNLNKNNIGTHNIVIIGGESHGVGKNAYRFMELTSTKGNCLYIPIADGVDSLNVVSALTLILYELRRHLIT